MQDKTNLNIIGPDVNEFRGDIDYKLLATKTPYCYLRASSSGTGKFRVDKRFLEYAKGMKGVGIATGAYHYALPSADFTTADQQCDDFINLLQQAYGTGNYGDLFPVVDVEAPVDKSISTDTLLDWVDRFRKRFEKKTRRKLMLYTGAFFIDLYNNFYHSKTGFILSNMPLWIAMYTEIKGNPPYPKDQGGWTRWTIWQFTEKGNIAGVNPPVDLNYGPVNLDYLMPPRAVKNFKAIPTKNTIKVTWTPNTDVDLNGYNIFLNSNYVTSVSKNSDSYEIKLGRTPKANEKFEVAIEAYDKAGDFSPTRAKAMVVFNGRNEKYNYDYDFMYKEYYESEENYKDPVDLLDEVFVKGYCNSNEYGHSLKKESREEQYILDWDNDDEFDDEAFMREFNKTLSNKSCENNYYNSNIQEDIDGTKEQWNKKDKNHIFSEENRRREENQQDLRHKSGKHKKKHCNGNCENENIHPYWNELDCSFKNKCYKCEKEQKKCKKHKHHK